MGIIVARGTLLNDCKALEQRVTVLIADDSPVSRKLVEYALSDRDYFLIFSKNGQQALQRVAEQHPDIVVVDWQMPDLNGLEICKHIRSTAKEFYSYIIVLTGKTEKNSVVAGLEAGADDYLTKPFDPDELVARVQVGLRMIQLYRQLEAKNVLLEELALTDSLTGLPNRRAVEQWSKRQLSGALRHGYSFHVAMADLDHFKRINDTYGHDAGDTVLKRFAEILKANCRNSDICGRMGGEEFLFAFSHASDKNAELIVERVRRQLEAAEFTFLQHSLAVTASFGLAGSDEKRRCLFDSLVSQADAALYDAKRRGRNQLRTAPIPPV